MGYILVPNITGIILNVVSGIGNLCNAATGALAPVIHQHKTLNLSCASYF